MNSWETLNQRIVGCDRCKRLRAHCLRIAQQKRRAYQDCDYWGRPVPNFGDPQARLLIVGLAPAAHGANRTGRMFTGDRSGEWLYRALHQAGFANQEEAVSRDDGLTLTDCAITAICHCAPPENKPARDEVDACHPFLNETFALLPIKVILALGQIAWRGAFRQIQKLEWRQGGRPKFQHGAEISLQGGRWIVASYHPSQQNTFTGRLTEGMFQRVFSRARVLLAQ